MATNDKEWARLIGEMRMCEYALTQIMKYDYTKSSMATMRAVEYEGKTILSQYTQAHKELKRINDGNE